MRCLSILFIVAFGGCSFVFARGPHSNAADAPCTESLAPPVVDTVLAVGMTAGGVAALLAQTTCTRPDPNDVECLGAGLAEAFSRAAGVVLVVSGIVHAVSAIRGYSVTGACRRVHATANTHVPALAPAP